MPYIQQEIREQIEMNGKDPRTPGELNYVITIHLLDYLDDQESYTKYNEIIGVLECVKQEFYRRLISSYEDLKITENGDVYE